MVEKAVRTQQAHSPREDRKHLRIVFLGGFGLRPKATMRFRALPMGQALVAAGHEVTLIMPPWDCPEDAGREWIEGGVRIANVPLPTHPRAALSIPAVVRALVRAMHAVRPDIVHLFQPKGYGGLAAITLRDIPMVVDIDDWEGAGGWNDVNPYPLPQRRLFAWQERDLPRRAAACTVASTVLAQRIASFGVPGARTTYLPNALAPDRAATWQACAEYAAKADTLRLQLGLARPKMLLYTRFQECAPGDVAGIFARVRERLPHVRLLIVGGSDAARSAFAPFGDAVMWAGDVPFAELPVYLRAADVALVPFADTPINRAKCSVKTLDLLALGVPTVATAVGENAHMIRDGETGILVPPGAPGKIADALVSLLTDASRRAMLGNAARKRAWREQTWEHQLPELLAAYQTICPSTASRRRR